MENTLPLCKEVFSVAVNSKLENCGGIQLVSVTLIF